MPKLKPKQDSDSLALNAVAIVKAESGIESNALEVEDSWESTYTNDIIQPEIPPDVFYALVEQNNTLSQCISAMEVNVDGTGYDIVRTDGMELTDGDVAEVQGYKDMLNEIYPGTSLLSLRRDVRRHLETAGYAGVEVIRNPAGEIVFLRPIESKYLRLMKAGNPIPVKRSLTRKGKTVTITVLSRERRFVQKIGTSKVYFKEYGASRDLDKETGKWAAQGTRLPAKKRATEILYFRVQKAHNSPYGVPRWINQLPSVIGSRAAEELNLEFFNSGGIPPILIFVSGGVLATTARKQLEGLLSGKAKDKLKGLVADIQSTSGSIDKGGSVGVTVESFGSDRQNDSMFEGYDERCERRVRASFRLPPLFVGRPDDYSYASVFASYTLAEAQVFSPERTEWDEQFNNTVMKELTGGKYKIVSKPLAVADAETVLKALELAKESKVITKDTLVSELNKVGNLTLSKLDEGGSDIVEPTAKTTVQGKQEPVQAKKADVGGLDLSYLSTLADSVVGSLLGSLTKDEVEDLNKELSGLTQVQEELVNLIASSKVYSSMDHDPEGIAELCGCAATNG